MFYLFFFCKLTSVHIFLYLRDMLKQIIIQQRRKTCEETTPFWFRIHFIFGWFTYVFCSYIVYSDVKIKHLCSNNVFVSVEIHIQGCCKECIPLLKLWRRKNGLYICLFMFVVWNQKPEKSITEPFPSFLSYKLIFLQLSLTWFCYGVII